MSKKDCDWETEVPFGRRIHKGKSSKQRKIIREKKVSAHFCGYDKDKNIDN